MASLKHKKHVKLIIIEPEYSEEDFVKSIQDEISDEISSRCNYDCYEYDCGYCDENCRKRLYASLKPLVKQLEILDKELIEDYLEEYRNNK